MEKLILGIETSCDDTSVCLLKGDPNTCAKPQLLSHMSFGQGDLLKKWGGVVPELAARNHLQKLTPLLKAAFAEAQVSVKELDLIGVTTSPGLLGPLLTGLNGAKSISLLHKTPIRPVNHLFAHLEAVHLNQEISYPYLGLLVSGGHSLYLLASSPTDFKVLGSTIDDAAGEAFDKGGKLLGLGYPAGHIVDKIAGTGDPLSFEFPIGLKSSKDARLSFSGLKTSLRVVLEKNPELLESQESQLFRDLCASYQYAIVGALTLKLRYALEKGYELTGKKLPVVVGGGVACNSALRNALKQKFDQVHFVDPKYCTDNGAMIANYAYRTFDQAIAFPECLALDARGRFIDKKKFNIKKVKKKASRDLHA